MLEERGPACMAKPYSADLRTRVAAAIAGGESSRSIAERFSIAPSTVVKWSRRVRQTRSSAPAKFGGYRTCSLAPHRAFVLEQIEEIPHLTLHRLKDLLGETLLCGLARPPPPTTRHVATRVRPRHSSPVSGRPRRQSP